MLPDVGGYDHVANVLHTAGIQRVQDGPPRPESSAGLVSRGAAARREQREGAERLGLSMRRAAPRRRHC